MYDKKTYMINDEPFWTVEKYLNPPIPKVYKGTLRSTK